MITAEKIREAKQKLNLSSLSKDHDNNIRIAFEWLDAQMISKIFIGKKFDLKSLLSDWGGKQISHEEIDVAAHLHPGISGGYPFYNINPQLTYPSAERLRNNIDSIMQNHKDLHILVNYRYYENVTFASDDGRSAEITFHREELPVPKYDAPDFCELNDCECYYCVYGR